MTGSIEAEVILRPAPRAPSRSSARLDAAAIASDVARKLSRLGFHVRTLSPLTISIAGTRRAYENVFDAVFGRNDAPIGPLHVPDQLSHEVEGVYIQAAPQYFP